MPLVLLIMLFLGLSPRLAIILIALFTNWFDRGYSTVIWPVLGFFFMPYTTLAYLAASINCHGGSFTFPWVLLVIFGVLFDFANNASVSVGRSSD